MNNTLGIIRKRHSVRDFRLEQITDSETAAIVEAGMYALSGSGNQSWYFAAAQNTKLLYEFPKAVKRIYTSLVNPFLQSQGKNEEYHLFYHAQIDVAYPVPEKLNIPDGYKQYFSAAFGFRKNENLNVCRERKIL